MPMKKDVLPASSSSFWTLSKPQQACMKMTLFVVSAPLLLIISVASVSAQNYPLGMAENSVDDDFVGCEKNMENTVVSKYIKLEKMNTPGFAAAWEKALNLCPKDVPNRNQCAAMYLYTGEKKGNSSFKQFNAATHNGKEAYKSDKFQFYTLFFYLTDAVKQLKLKECLTVYRRTNYTYPTDVLNKEIRFGSFASTSLVEPPLHFGNKSCFEVETCFGANVTNNSRFSHEREVLIPPYEVFRVTKITKKDKQNKDLWCDVVYELKSTNYTKSDLNCAKVPS
ncbi:NAD(P)(+)--arginine ADP-ribosyltransferase 2-like [Astyanax mexicanus]|uniref:NAD(P)(+)--arginine ADP-ribosyltransferase 2-like n=1 Tax=Astyanax mexicanus TaxID=7994 RepID=UPI0020CAB9D3|nr:NAD(P)(+)--arginine ADP-ribosyltransferase 2-like [Astyanax mexicanus]